MHVEASPADDPQAVRRCARPGCANPVLEEWDEAGRFCPSCALDADLFDRRQRWERATPRSH